MNSVCINHFIKLKIKKNKLCNSLESEIPLVPNIRLFCLNEHIPIHFRFLN